MIPITGRRRSTNRSVRGTGADDEQIIIDYEEPWNQLHVDLKAIQSNYLFLRQKVPQPAVLYAVLKANAYGHGIVEIGRALEAVGARHFAVETPQEGIQLRKIGFDGEILLMNPIPEWMAEMSVYHDFSVSIIHESILHPLAQACELMDKTCRLHFNLNVGLHRMGIAPSKIAKLVGKATELPRLKNEGLFAQPRDDRSAAEGYQKLNQICTRLAQKRLAPDNVHYANSTALLSHPEMIGNGARIGILLYGVLPPEQHNQGVKIPQLVPAMSLTSSLVQIRELEKGAQIGYRAKHRTERDSIIGTLPIGYSHGLDRKLSDSGYVLVRGQKAPFIGAVSMNSSTIDLTDLEGAKRGDRVTILGKQGDEQIVINQLAEQSKTISADVMVRIGAGIARRYKLGSNVPQEKTCTSKGGQDQYGLKILRTEKDFPTWLNVPKIIDFLKVHLAPYDDKEAEIHKAVDYSLSSYKHGDGFLVLAYRNRSILGMVVCAETDTAGFIPENILVYVCVNQNFRNQGIGRRIMNEAFENTDGSFKFHVEPDNPAMGFYEKMGFTTDYLEMRYCKGDR